MRRLALLVAAACACAAQAAPQASVELLPEARVSAPQVTLGDVARLNAPSLPLMRKLVNLPLGTSPQPGQAAVVQRQALADWVRKSLGVEPDQLKWSGSPQARVVRVARRLRGDEIADAGMAAVRQWLAEQGQAGEARVRFPVRDMDIPEGDVRLQPRPIEHAPLRNRLLVWVDVWLGEQFVRAVAVPLEVEAVKANPAKGSEPLLAAEMGAMGVQRGEWAALRAGTGAVLLESRVEVLQDGRMGQSVRVRPATGTGPLTARVVGRGQLELAP